MSEQKPLSVNDLLAFCLDQFAAIAWQKLGLQPDAMTHSVSEDFSEAKLAIDMCGIFAEKLMPSLDEEDKRQVQTLVSDLRINYVKKTGLS